MVRSGEPVDGGEGSGEGSTGAGTDGAGTRVAGSDVPGTDVVGTDAVGTDVSEPCRWLGFGCGTVAGLAVSFDRVSENPALMTIPAITSPSPTTTAGPARTPS